MDHGSLTGDRGFESVFLQRRVRRELRIASDKAERDLGQSDVDFRAERASAQRFAVGTGPNAASGSSVSVWPVTPTGSGAVGLSAGLCLAAFASLFPAAAARRRCGASLAAVQLDARLHLPLAAPRARHALGASLSYSSQ
jgi:hypothetical protein